MGDDDDDDDDGLLELLLTYACSFIGANRVAGVGTVEPNNVKRFGCTTCNHYRLT